MLIALGSIILIGSLAAAGCLYAPLGHWSLAIGGTGLIAGSGLMAVGLCTHRISKKTRLYESREKEYLNHQPEKQPQIPIKASDINLPQLPKEIPSTCDISGKEWLSNAHLHMYITYLITQFPDASLYIEPLPVDRWERYSRNQLMKYIFNYLPSKTNHLNKFNLPIYLCIKNHWTLVYIDREKRTVEYYDSKMNYGDFGEIEKTLTIIANDLSKQEPNKPPYKFVRKINKVLQPDSYQCGIWTLYFLESRLINPDFDFNQLDVNESQKIIKKYRTKVMLKLIELEKVMEAALKKERENYRNYYKDETLARKMHRQDLQKMSYADRWSQILKNQFLVPSH